MYKKNLCVYEMLEKLGLILPPAPQAVGLYSPVKQSGNLLYVSGQGFIRDGKALIQGKAGSDVSLEQAQEAARGAALNMLSVLDKYTSDLNRIGSVVKLLGFIASAPGFNNQPKVLNAASQLFIDLFGEAGRAARSAVGVNELPLNLTVELEGIFELLGGCRI